MVHEIKEHVPPWRAHSNAKVQKRVYGAFCRVFHDFDSAWQSLCSRRLNGANPVELFSFLCRFTKASSAYASLCVVKTLVGSWFTDVRLHTQGVRPCVFGCDARDDLAHYQCCWALKVVLLRVGLAVEADCNWDFSSSAQSFLSCFVSYVSYHAVRFHDVASPAAIDFAVSWAVKALDMQFASTAGQKIVQAARECRNP